MSKGMIGKKIGMTGLFSPEGLHVPATVVKTGPCIVTHIKTVETDGYNAIQVGFDEKKESRVNKPCKGHLKKVGKGFFRFLREFKINDPESYSIGQKISLDMFKIGERVNVTGNIKGRGFSGVIKRHGFHGGKKTHGSKSHRIPGSIGCSAWPAKVIKGKKMPGHYGNTRNTVKNLEILDVRPEKNIIIVKGAVPGYKSGLVYINKLQS